jgi:four helix bundle protein
VEASGRPKVKAGGANRGLEGFSAYTKALALFDLVAEDAAALAGKYEVSRLVAQQLASADSIASNIEEGYGRGSKKDYSHFLIIARGSAQETLGRCRRLGRWLEEARVKEQSALLNEIIAILTTTIRTLRAEL